MALPGRRPYHGAVRSPSRAAAVGRATGDGPYIIHASSEVWIVRLADQHVDRLRDTPVGDLEWSPDGPRLAIASGDEGEGTNLPAGEILRCIVDSGEMQWMQGAVGAGRISWSPDGSRIVYDRSGALVVRDLTSGAERRLATFESSGHGIGPMWSPEGSSLLYVGGPGLLIVPITSGGPPTILADGTIEPEDGAFDVPLQRWGRRRAP